MKKYWVCIIGPVDEKKLPPNADFAPRVATQEAVIETLGTQYSCWSGWDCSQKKFEAIMDAWNRGDFK